MSEMSDVSAALTDQLDRLLAAGVDRDVRRDAEAGTFPAGLWASVEALGLGPALAGEEFGGAGLAWPDVGGVLKALGYHAAPLPLGETIASAFALGRAGIAPPEGIVVPLEGMLRREAGGAVAGAAVNVPFGAQAEHFVACVQDGPRAALCLLSARDAEVTPTTSIGRDPRAGVRFGAARPVATAAAPSGLEGGLAVLLALLRSVQIAGALSRCLEISIEYANTRVQFGRPIGKFQALQHMSAEFAAESAAAGIAAAAALRAMDGAAAEDAVAVAKVRCGIAAGRGAAAAHALHGAIGVTDEHILHYFTRRLWQWRDDAGNEHAWAERLGRRILARPGRDLWPGIVALSG